MEDALAQSFTWLDESGAETLRPRALETRAALAVALGDEASSARDLAEALQLYRAQDLPHHVERLARKIGE